MPLARVSLSSLAATVLLAVHLTAPTHAQGRGDTPKKQAPVGYRNTPVIPGQKWRVHDADRPRPTVVKPGTASTELAPGRPPADAVVLFSGKNLDAWTSRQGGAAGWKVAGGYFEVNGTGSIHSRQKFGDCQLHVEWQTPSPPKGKSQGRGNSGVFLMSRYEIQILDSYDNVSYADGQAAAIYGQHPPLVNAARQPGIWQTYDIIFTAPRFQAGKLVSPAYVTLLHNGVLVHNHRQLIGATTHKSVAKYRPHPAEGPIRLQDHGNPTRFRNIWIRRLGTSPGHPRQADRDGGKKKAVKIR